MRSPAGVSLILVEVAESAVVPLGWKIADRPTRDRKRERERKYIDTPGTFLQRDRQHRKAEAVSDVSVEALVTRRFYVFTYRYSVGTVPRQSPATPSRTTTSFAVDQIDNRTAEAATALDDELTRGRSCCSLVLITDDNRLDQQQ